MSFLFAKKCDVQQMKLEFSSFGLIWMVSSSCRKSCLLDKIDFATKAFSKTCFTICFSWNKMKTKIGKILWRKNRNYRISKSGSTKAAKTSQNFKMFWIGCLPTSVMIFVTLEQIRNFPRFVSDCVVNLSRALRDNLFL